MKNSQNCLTMLSLIIASSCIAAPVYAADQYGKSDIQESGTASVTEGSLTESGDKGSDSLYGGYAQITGSSGGNATVTDSKAYLTNVTTTGGVGGGFSNNGCWKGGEVTTTDCKLTINGGTYSGYIAGGNAYFSGVREAASCVGTVKGNTLEVTGEAVLEGGSAGGEVHFGLNVEYFLPDNIREIVSCVGTVKDNHLIITNSESTILFGGYIEILGTANSAVVDDNSVTVTSSTVTPSVDCIYGGSILAHLVSDSLSTNNNTVTVTDSTVKGKIYGGKITISSGSKSTESDATCQGNTVIVKKSNATSLYGGYVNGEQKSSSFYGLTSTTASFNHVIRLFGDICG